MSPVPRNRGHSNCQKGLAEFAAKTANKVPNIFARGVYVGENTSQAASVEFVCRRQTNYARSRLRKNWRKSPKGFSTSSMSPVPRNRGHCFKTAQNPQKDGYIPHRDRDQTDPHGLHTHQKAVSQVRTASSASAQGRWSLPDRK